MKRAIALLSISWLSIFLSFHDGWAFDNLSNPWIVPRLNGRIKQIGVKPAIEYSIQIQDENKEPLQKVPDKTYMLIERTNVADPQLSKLEVTSVTEPSPCIIRYEAVDDGSWQHGDFRSATLFLHRRYGGQVHRRNVLTGEFESADSSKTEIGGRATFVSEKEFHGCTQEP